MRRKGIAFAILALALLVRPEPFTSDDEVFLYRAVEKVAPGHFPLNQGNIGTCVAFGYGAACDTLLALDVAMGKSSKFVPHAEESIYGGARNESYNRVSRSYSDGSNGYAAQKWLTKAGGAIYRQKYPDFGLDLTNYSTSLAKDWGAYGNGGRSDGIGGKFDLEAQKTPLKSAVLIKTLEELDVALKNGYPVPICSGQGFNNVRDKDGFCRPQGKWSHCMVLIAKRNGGRKGYLVLNSWGSSWVSGPKYKDQPDGSFYAEPSVIQRILNAGDSYALAGQSGFVKKLLPFWLTDANAEVPHEAPDENNIPDERDSRVYFKDGYWRFDEDGKHFRFFNGKWYECNQQGCFPRG